MTTRAAVAVLKATPETVLEDYDRLIGLAQVEKHLPADTTVILKDNISWHFPFPSANTTPWQLEGTIRALERRGYKNQVCVQNRTVVTNAFKGEDLNNYVPIFRRYGIPVLYNFKESDMSWEVYEPKAQMDVLPRIYPEGIRIPTYFLNKGIVHLPTVKCHIYTTTTGAMKNAFGGLLNHKRHYTHTWIHETLVDLLKIQQEIHSGVFAVMDGTTAGNGTGPRVMKPEVKNVILASGDQVAIDAVAASLMGFDPLQIKYIRMAHEQGLGVGDLREIEIVGDDIAGENWHFEVGVNLHRVLGWLSWYGPTRFLQKVLFHTPLVHATAFVSEAYHDYYRWPLKERHVYDRWRRETGWGQLFDRYKQEGSLR
ncbi:MAG: DUF362 domain-containing protein [Anaerolineae bacterium]|jgi:uncharacterized protein (DUF362 family)